MALAGPSHGYSQVAPHLADLSLHFPQLPLVSLGIPLELVVMVLEAADQVAHLTVDGPGLLVGRQVLFKLDAQHLILLAHLGQRVLQLDNLCAQLLLQPQLIALGVEPIRIHASPQP